MIFILNHILEARSKTTLLREERLLIFMFLYGSIISLFLSCEVQSNEPEQIDNTEKTELDFITGMDLSYQPFLTDFGTQFYDETGAPIDNFMQWTKDNGVNLIRLRLFHTPDSNDAVVAKGSLTHTLALAKQIKTSGNSFLLDFHYSDTWADPGKQFPPAAWDGLSKAAVLDGVYHYTKAVLEAFAAQNTLPDIVQIGNEINSGMLWDYGKVWNEFEDNWGSLAALIQQANKAIEEVATAHKQPIQSMIHIAGIKDAHYFFEELAKQNVSFDIIGLSYYAWWHGTDFVAMENALQQLALQFDKPIIIAETSYPFTLDWADWTNNVVGSEEHLINGFPATPEGQHAFYEHLVQTLKSLPNERGKGFVWWAPDYVAFNGENSTKGSAFENLTTFDFERRALPVMEVFRKY